MLLQDTIGEHQALCLVQEDDGYYFSADSFIEEMRAIQFTGSCQCAYHYVAYWQQHLIGAGRVKQ